jgi:hypothetical protein
LVVRWLPQMFTRCVGSANTPYDSAQRAVRQYLALGIPPSKLVLGLPWYGYDYACQPGPDGKPAPPDVDVCLMASVPFRGVACSDAAGAQRNYDYIVQREAQGWACVAAVICMLWLPACRTSGWELTLVPRC